MDNITEDKSADSKHGDKYIITLKKNKDHQPRKVEISSNNNNNRNSCGKIAWLPRLPPKRNFVVTMDRSEMKRETVLPPLLFVPKHRLHVGNMNVRQPVLSFHPKLGSRHMVLEDKPVKEIYGSANPTIDELREKESQILGVLDFHNPPIKPDWRHYVKGDYIYREPDPNWLGSYQEMHGDFNKEAKSYLDVLKKVNYNSDEKRRVRFVENSYHSKYNEKYVYSPDTVKRHYIERSFNPRSQKQTNSRNKSKFIENSFNPHFHKTNPHSKHKDIGYYDKVPYDPDEKFNVRYLPPIERKGKYADVSSKVKSFDNAGYQPGGGHRQYPTFVFRWVGQPKIDSWNHLKQSKSAANSETGSVEFNFNKEEVQSQIEFQGITDDNKTQCSKSPTKTVASSGINSFGAKSATRTVKSAANNSVWSSKNSKKSINSANDITILQLPGASAENIESQAFAKSVVDNQPDNSTQGTDLQSYDHVTYNSQTPEMDTPKNYSVSNESQRKAILQGDDTNTVSDVASLPKQHNFVKNYRTNVTVLNAKSPISKFQKLKMSDLQNHDSKATNDFANTKPVNIYAYGPRLRQAKSINRYSKPEARPENSNLTRPSVLEHLIDKKDISVVHTYDNNDKGFALNKTEGVEDAAHITYDSKRQPTKPENNSQPILPDVNSQPTQPEVNSWPTQAGDNIQATQPEDNRQPTQPDNGQSIQQKETHNKHDVDIQQRNNIKASNKLNKTSDFRIIKSSFLKQPQRVT